MIHHWFSVCFITRLYVVSPSSVHLYVIHTVTSCTDVGPCLLVHSCLNKRRSLIHLLQRILQFLFRHPAHAQQHRHHRPAGLEPCFLYFVQNWRGQVCHPLLSKMSRDKATRSPEVVIGLICLFPLLVLLLQVVHHIALFLLRCPLSLLFP